MNVAGLKAASVTPAYAVLDAQGLKGLVTDQEFLDLSSKLWRKTIVSHFLHCDPVGIIIVRHSNYRQAFFDPLAFHLQRKYRHISLRKYGVFYLKMDQPNFSPGGPFL